MPQTITPASVIEAGGRQLDLETDASYHDLRKQAPNHPLALMLYDLNERANVLRVVAGELDLIVWRVSPPRPVRIIGVFMIPHDMLDHCE